MPGTKGCVVRARHAILLVLFALVLATAASAHAAVPKLIFPVAGPVTYSDDFGAARGTGSHEGNDLMAAKKTPVLAVEAGRVKFWTTSSNAGCMLYLYGKSGTTYYYIHLNNDLTLKNDNRGKCVPGVSYAKGLKDGAQVTAGQMIGYVGDSGDANGIAPHLHFEVHPNGGNAVDPYTYLQAATQLLFFAKVGTPFTLSLTGTVVSATDTLLKVQVSLLQAFPMNLTYKNLTRVVTVKIPPTATVLPAADRLLSAYDGETVTIWTQPALATMKALTGADLTAALVQLGL
jgi:Peptidase family M23